MCALHAAERIYSQAGLVQGKVATVAARDDKRAEVARGNHPGGDGTADRRNRTVAFDVDHRNGLGVGGEDVDGEELESIVGGLEAGRGRGLGQVQGTAVGGTQVGIETVDHLGGERLRVGGGGRDGGVGANGSQEGA